MRSTIGCSVGFQSLCLYGDPLAGFADIATFARMHPKIPGALFLQRGKQPKNSVSNSSMRPRADNVSVLAYYTKMGFEDYDRLIDVPLLDGASRRPDQEALQVGRCAAHAYLDSSMVWATGRDLPTKSQAVKALLSALPSFQIQRGQSGLTFSAFDLPVFRS
ncbi:hypothetical protein BN77_p30015 [Rhizobium mesoamericanum STM3625]|uniref:Uncharacterized protein n=1 Tax=Rhizobium mesoamericanum STM3625 TaxID=1211777 RepID=K0PZY8_9HYPH|nr:hypothetical protein BN77_p30015 [Rhizobium mesoamericanum STM3625]